MFPNLIHQQTFSYNNRNIRHSKYATIILKYINIVQTETVSLQTVLKKHNNNVTFLVIFTSLSFVFTTVINKIKILSKTIKDSGLCLKCAICATVHDNSKKRKMPI